MRLGDVMTRQLQSVQPDASLQEAAMMMRTHNIGIVPVVEPDGKPVGVLTDRDLAIRAVADDCDMTTTDVRKIMTQEIVKLSEEHDLEEAMDLMQQKQVRRVLITNNQGQLRGILSASDAAALCNGDMRAGQLAAELSRRTRIHLAAS